MTKGKFGGDAYKPKQLGPEPAQPGAPAGAAMTAATTPPSEPPPAPPSARSVGSAGKLDAATMAALRSVKVPFSSRITVGADQQLKAMAKEGRSVTDLLAEALNLLFKKHGHNQIA
jgi:hypothetical protein